MWNLESRSRLLLRSLGLVSEFDSGLDLGGYGLDYITARNIYGTILHPA